MKLIVLSLFLSSLALGNLITVGSRCPEQQVPNAQGICLRPLYIEGCGTYKNANECDECVTGYEKDETNVGKCSLVVESSRVSEKMNGCLEGDGQVCGNCANGFRKVGTTCRVGVKFCEVYDNEDKCSKCESEFSLIFGECKHNSVLGCKIESSDHTCQECFRPFVLDGFHCVVPNCKSLNDYGCIACECNFFIANDRTCKPMPNGCLKTYRGVCSECLPHYKLKGGVCLIEGCLSFGNGLCTACQSDYDMVDGTCRFKNCFDWKDETCQVCNKGFNMVGGRCVQSTSMFVCEG